MNIFTSRSGTGFPYTCKVYLHVPGASSVSAVTLPSGPTGTPYRPCLIPENGRWHVVGEFSSNLVVLEDGSSVVAGIPAPSKAPVLAASGTGITGECIGYLTFVQKLPNGTVLQESDPSKTSNTLSLTNQGRAWSGLPTTCPNARVTHIRGYVSVDGGLPRLVWERELGATTVTENVPTVTAANSTSLPVDTDGNLDTTARGVPPAARIAVKFHDRMWYIVWGKKGIYFSKLNESESQDPTDFLRTKDGEQPLGAGVVGDELLVLCAESAYAVTGWGSGDFAMRKVSADVGSLNHAGIITRQGMLVVPSHQGYAVYSGGQFRSLMARSLRSYWTDAYAAAPSVYEDVVACDDHEGNFIALTSPSSGNRSFSYVGNYRAMTEDGQAEPWWGWDVRTRTDTWVGVIAGGTSQRRVQVAIGSSDGYVRIQDATDDDDDSDSYAKLMTWTHGHLYLGDLAGDDSHGRTYTDLDFFLKNTDDDVTLKAWAGDHERTTAAAPDWTATQEAVDDTSLTPKLTHHYASVEISGKGITVGGTAASPVGVEVHGYAVWHREGPQSPRAAK